MIQEMKLIPTQTLNVWFYKNNLRKTACLMGDRYYYRNLLNTEEIMTLLQVTTFDHINIYSRLIKDIHL